MFTKLETLRLNLRPIQTGDAGFMYSLMNSNGWLNNIGNRNINNHQDARAYIEKILDNKNYFYHVFEFKENHNPAGILTFLLRENRKYPDLGFAILPEFENRGLTYEAASAYLKEITSNTAYNEIHGICLPENSSSINLLKKLGMSFKETEKTNTEILSIYSLKKI